MRFPLRMCNGQIQKSNVQVFPGNLFRSGLGVGMSPAIKKTPQMVYRPGVGLVQVMCCIIPTYVPPPPVVFSIVDGGNPSGSGPNIYDGGTPSGSGALIIDGGNP